MSRKKCQVADLLAISLAAYQKENFIIASFNFIKHYKSLDLNKENLTT